MRGGMLFDTEDRNMYKVDSSEKLKIVHSDIRGPVYEKSLELSAKGIEVLKLNTGNPATFGFPMPDSVKNAILTGLDNATAYCDARGMAAARAAICAYHTGNGFQGRPVVGISPVLVKIAGEGGRIQVPGALADPEERRIHLQVAAGSDRLAGGFGVFEGLVLVVVKMHAQNGFR